MARKKIIDKIIMASDESIRTDHGCVGKHWWLMDFYDRTVCPYCDWRLTMDDLTTLRA